MTTTEPVNVVWGVQWEIFVMPESFAGSMPVQPDSMSEDPTEEEREAWQAYITANAEFEAQMVNLAADDDNWSTTVSVAASGEDEARQMLGYLNEANAGNPFNRNFRLVQAVAPVWTEVTD